MQKNKFPPIAYCSSQKCSSDIRFENASKYAIKQVHISTIECPQCGSILIWKKDMSKEALKYRKMMSGKNKNADSRKEYF